jgi:hypothetical protein
MEKKTSQPKEEKELAKVPEKSGEMPMTTLNPEVLITQAIKNNVSVETMERLLAMRKELKAEFAKEEFDKAMADFQRECPAITKNKSVFEKSGGKVRYKFASLDSIIEQTKNTISNNGLSYTIRTKSDDKMFTATVKVSHVAGHSEESEFSIPISSEQFMTDVQKFGARSTFAKRYAFLNAFGIMTGDEDSEKTVGIPDQPKTNADSLKKDTAPEKITPEQIKILNEQLARTGKTLSGLLVHLKKNKISELTHKEAKTWIVSLQVLPNAQSESTSPVDNGPADNSKDEVIDGEIVEEMPEKETPKKPKVELKQVAPEDEGPMRKAWSKMQKEKEAKAEQAKNIEEKIPKEVLELIDFYNGCPEAEWPEGLKELKTDCASGNFQGKGAYPNLF